ncbi:MAG: anthrone oxygenase family protein [Myxococcota bacterium]
MMSLVANIGTWAAAIGCGVMAGIYFAFSTFVMKALAGIPRTAGIAAMQSINEVIVSSAFLPLFFGTSLLGAGLAGWSLTQWGGPGASLLLVGGLVYVLGMFVCTAVFNVPLNDALAAVEPDGFGSAELWSAYLERWTLWNHVRTVASAVACGLFIAAIVASS